VRKLGRRYRVKHGSFVIAGTETGAIGIRNGGAASRRHRAADGVQTTLGAPCSEGTAALPHTRLAMSKRSRIDRRPGVIAVVDIPAFNDSAPYQRLIVEGQRQAVPCRGIGPRP